MDPSRYNLNYSMSSSIGLVPEHDMYGSPAAMAALSSRPPSGGLLQSMSPGGFGGRSGVGLLQCQGSSSSLNNTGGSQQRGIKRSGSDCYDDHHRGGGSGGLSSQSIQTLENQQQSGSGSGGNIPDVGEDSYSSIQSKKSPPANGKKTKGRVKIKMEYIDNKLRRYTTFSKRKTGIMKKAYELSTLTGTQVMLLVASETGHVYTFATRKLQPMITSEAGKQLIQTCLNSPDPPGAGGGDQRMSATGFEETELSYNIADEDSKDEDHLSPANDSEDSSDFESPNGEQFSGQTICRSNDAVNAKETTNSKKTSNLALRKNERNPAEFTLSGYTKENRITATGTTNTADGRTRSSNSSVSNLPQDMLMHLIKSGHLQLHTEEDGSGHQYVAIPLDASMTSRLGVGPRETSSENQSSAEFQKSNSRIRENRNESAEDGHNKPKSGSYHSKSKTDITIKREPQ